MLSAERERQIIRCGRCGEKAAAGRVGGRLCAGGRVGCKAQLAAAEVRGAGACGAPSAAPHTFHSATSPFLSPETSSSRPPAASVRTLWWWHSSGPAAGTSSCGSQRRTSCSRWVGA